MTVVFGDQAVTADVAFIGIVDPESGLGALARVADHTARRPPQA